MMRGEMRLTHIELLLALTHNEAGDFAFVAFMQCERVRAGERL